MDKTAKATAFILDTILTADIPGREQSDDQIRDLAARWRPALMAGFLHVSWNQEWGVVASLTVNVRMEDEKLLVRCEVNWGTTVYTLDKARKAVNLHEAVVTLAEKIQKEFAA